MAPMDRRSEACGGTWKWRTRNLVANQEAARISGSSRETATSAPVRGAIITTRIVPRINPTVKIWQNRRPPPNMISRVEHRLLGRLLIVLLPAARHNLEHVVGQRPLERV